MSRVTLFGCSSVPSQAPVVEDAQTSPAEPTPPVAERFASVLLEPGAEAEGMARAEPVDLGSLESPDLALVEGVPWVVAIE